MSRIERLLMLTGLLLIGICVVAYAHRELLSQLALAKFREATISRAGKPTSSAPESSQMTIDFSLWSENRVAAYKRSLTEYVAAPLAILKIPKVKLEVPVLEGTDDLTLNRGVGHIAGTGPPGSSENIGIAGHRDGFFRVLKDISIGDEIQLTTVEHTDSYIVDGMSFVRPQDVSALEPRSEPSITLVTCYPFYFMGSAPQRFIVHAKRNAESHDTQTD